MQQVLEIAQIRVKAGLVDDFLSGVRRSLPLFQAAHGFSSLTLRRSLEEPLLFRLMIEWERLEDHTELFRNSPAFLAWRQNVGPYFAEPPQVDHSTVEISA